MDFDPKLAILFLLIGAIVSLSHVGGGTLDRLRRQTVDRTLDRTWRKFVLTWRKG
jgi:hypothetical protein